MKNKITPINEALNGLKDGITIMVGGFGTPGTPMTLVKALYDSGVKDITLIKNEANEEGLGVSPLIEAGRVRKLIVTHLGLNTKVVQMMYAGELEVEFHPQGIFAEKIRCGGSGLPGFLTDIGIDTILRDSRPIMEFEGQEVLIEKSLRADIALIHAATADTLGNLVYTKSARNFNPLMAMAGDLVIAECADIRDPGKIDPDLIHTPGPFVDRLVQLDGLSEQYGVLKHHVLQK